MRVSMHCRDCDDQVAIECIRSRHQMDRNLMGGINLKRLRHDPAQGLGSSSAFMPRIRRALNFVLLICLLVVLSQGSCLPQPELGLTEGDELPESCAEAPASAGAIIKPLKGAWFAAAFNGCQGNRSSCERPPASQVWLSGEGEGEDITAGWESLRADRWSCDDDGNLSTFPCDRCKPKGAALEDTEIRNCAGHYTLVVPFVIVHEELLAGDPVRHLHDPRDGCEVAFPAKSDATWILYSPNASQTTELNDIAARLQVRTVVTEKTFPEMGDEINGRARQFESGDECKSTIGDLVPGECWIWQVQQRGDTWDVNFSNKLRITRIRIRRTDGSFAVPAFIVYAAGFDKATSRYNDFDRNKCHADPNVPSIPADDDGNFDLRECITDPETYPDSGSAKPLAATPTYLIAEGQEHEPVAWILKFDNSNERFQPPAANEELSIEFTVVPSTGW